MRLPLQTANLQTADGSVAESDVPDQGMKAAHAFKVNLAKAVANPTHHVEESPSSEPCANSCVPPDMDEPEQKKAKLEAFRTVCSEVQDNFLYVSGQDVAKDSTSLENLGVTHIINCAGPQCRNFLESENRYKYHNVNIFDHRSEELTWFIYGVFDFISAAKEEGGKVLIHCVQGVSRSCAFAIAWIMFTTGMTYEESYGTVRSKRGICSPNSGFICALLEWRKRRLQVPVRSFWRTAYHTPFFKHELLLKICLDVSNRLPCSSPLEVLDPRAANLILCEGEIKMWIGRDANAEMRTLVLKGVRWLVKYEGYTAAKDEGCVEQGKESEAFLRAIGVPEGVEFAPAPLAAYGDLCPGDSSSSAPAAGTVGKAEDVQLLPEGFVGRKPRLFECVLQDGGESYSWVHLAVYDDQDLNPDACYLLVKAEGDAAFAWIGQDFAGLDVDEAEDSAAALQSFVAQVALDTWTHGEFGQALVNLHTVKEGDETDAFWQVFEQGY